jgi:hypothetical protein
MNSSQELGAREREPRRGSYRWRQGVKPYKGCQGVSARELEPGIGIQGQCMGVREKGPGSGIQGQGARARAREHEQGARPRVVRKSNPS